MRPHLTIGSEGDSVVSRGEAGEDTRVKVELTTSSSWTITIVVVGEEGFKCHSLRRFDGSSPPGRDENNWKVAKRWVGQNIVVRIV